MLDVNERIVEFGTGNNAVGVLCSPVTIDINKPFVVLINGGVLHRVGPCRNNVLIARALASQGISSLRFDYPGVGDSKSDATENSGSDSVRVAFIATVLDYLQQELGVDRFVLHGLCSGARDAFQAALNDKRVVGISQIDSYTYRNLRFYLIKILPKLLSIRAWIHSIRVRMPGYSRGEKKEAGSTDMSTVVWAPYPPRMAIAQGYKTLVARGVSFFVVFTGSWRETYNYERQFFDLFSTEGLAACTTLQYMPDASHLLTRQRDRQEFIQGLQAYIDSLSV